MSAKGRVNRKRHRLGPNVFQPLASDQASGPCEIYADCFGGPLESPDKAEEFLLQLLGCRDEKRAARVN